MAADSTKSGTDYSDEEQDNFDGEEGPASKLSDRFAKQHGGETLINRIRRGSVSAEVIKPSDETTERVIVPKSDNAKMRIAASISNNLLFKNLEADQKREVVDAMFEKKVAPGEMIIKQGAEGDNFYVVDEGTFEILINDKKVVEVGPGGSFGELALMYNTPRAATVKAGSDGGLLWAVDRVTFRRCITNNNHRKRKLYESFLKTVPILSPLSPPELSRVADALEPITYDAGETIVEQGSSGDSFYIIVDGAATVHKSPESETCSAEAENKVGDLKKGDYFGELALLTQQPRQATVVASNEGECKVVCLDVQAFIRLLGPCMDILKRNTDKYEQYGKLIQE